ncbi:hypothetical protein Ataiwa_12060 [Algoriphagus taiwanensis]|uniref:Uncharacterized protein n=1 Tax=Algoriphagus taiwanensis TaxID=1445656 RepID=A0ABQ6PYC9_9BACT|nr:hypothetical protein Ataiwa_12060 [Algoriphagus taiwanensis]
MNRFVVSLSGVEGLFQLSKRHFDFAQCDKLYILDSL